MLQIVPPQAVAQQSSQVGFKSHAYGGFDAEPSGRAITGQKPESKLWFHDGEWWAAMLDPELEGAHTIHRLADETWVSTGVVIDSRPSIKEDVLSLGNKLYILARANGDAGDNKLMRFTYASGSYSPDTDFDVPVTVPGTRPEALTLARDSLDNLWVSYEQGGEIYVARTEGSDHTQWGVPFVIPVLGATGVLVDDISAVVSFSDNTGPAIGVMWSNQSADKISFAVHRDGAPDTSWSEETALSGALEANDHINMKTAQDQIFSVVKTSHTADEQPIIRLLVRSPSGSWEPHPVTFRSEGDKTRPIAVLHVDPSENKAYVFMTIDEGHLAEGIEYKATSLDDISFPTHSTPFIRGGNGEAINNATSMKANATAASGIVVMASGGSHYWWNRLGGSGPPANTAESKTNLKHRARPHRFLGKVKSDDARCISGRKLVIKKVRRGKDRVVARTTSRGNGKWSAPHKRGGRGRYYAVVKRLMIQDGAGTIRCLGGRSSTKRFRR
ncbi:MAG: hypothetical protein ACRDJL_10245 [Actinomycetota bacterium]